MNLGAPELFIVLAVVLLLFGGKKLPELARSLGQAQQQFRQGLEEGSSGTAEKPPADVSDGAPRR